MVNISKNTPIFSLLSNSSASLLYFLPIKKRSTELNAIPTAKYLIVDRVLTTFNAVSSDSRTITSRKRIIWVPKTVNFKFSTNCRNLSNLSMSSFSLILRASCKQISPISLNLYFPSSFFQSVSRPFFSNGNLKTAFFNI